MAQLPHQPLRRGADRNLTRAPAHRSLGREVVAEERAGGLRARTQDPVGNSLAGRPLPPVVTALLQKSSVGYAGDHERRRVAGRLTDAHAIHLQPVAVTDPACQTTKGLE